MTANRNTPQLWDEVWAAAPGSDGDRENFVREERSIRWRRMERLLLSEFGRLEGLKVIEIGAGAGTVSALLARRGAKVSLLDYSRGALQRSRDTFARNGLEAEFILQDALRLPPDLLERFDVSMSFGLAEHFRGEARARIIRAHFDVLRRGGLAFISVPNSYNPPYRIHKFLAERFGFWNVGEEFPFTRGELRKAFRSAGIPECSFFGDSIYSSLEFIDPFVLARRILKVGVYRINPLVVLMKLLRLPVRAPAPTPERGSLLDAYFSYALVAWGRKP